MITLLLVAAALAWLLWPKGGLPAVPAAADLFRLPPEVVPAPAPSPAQPAAREQPSEREAIDSLLVLRNRLSADGVLNEGSAKAIDQLALDLLHQGVRK